MIKAVFFAVSIICIIAGTTSDSETIKTEGSTRWRTPPEISNEIKKYPNVMNKTWISGDCRVYIYTVKSTNFSSNFSMIWKKGKDQFSFMLRDNGTICQSWDFGSLFSVVIILKPDSFYENWKIEDKVLQVFKKDQTKISRWTNDNSDVEGFKICRRYISSWCEENSEWFKLPCKIYQKIEDEDES